MWLLFAGALDDFREAAPSPECAPQHIVPPCSCVGAQCQRLFALTVLPASDWEANLRASSSAAVTCRLSRRASPLSSGAPAAGSERSPAAAHSSKDFSFQFDKPSTSAASGPSSAGKPRGPTLPPRPTRSRRGSPHTSQLGPAPMREGMPQEGDKINGDAGSSFEAVNKVCSSH